MELTKIKEILLDRIKYYDVTNIDINQIKMIDNEESLLRYIVSDLHNWLQTKVITNELLIELFGTPLLEENYIFIDGEHSIYGSKEVVALGNAIMRMYNNSTVHAFQNCVIYGYTLSITHTYDDVEAIVRDEATVYGYDNSVVKAYFKSKVFACNYCNVEAFEEVNVIGNNYSVITVDDYASVCAYGHTHVKGLKDNNIKLFDYSVGELMLRCCGEAHNYSTLMLFEDATGILYNKSIGRCYNNSECTAHDCSTLFSDGKTKIKGCNTACIHCTKASFAKVLDSAYMIDYSDTHCNVSNHATIRWANSGELFYVK